MSDTQISQAPWNEDQVKCLQEWQNTAWIHPYTSHDGIALFVTADGFVCPCGCDYTQSWCFAMSVEPIPVGNPIDPTTWSNNAL